MTTDRFGWLRILAYLCLLFLGMLSVSAQGQTHTFCPTDGVCTWTGAQNEARLTRDCRTDGVKADGTTDDGPAINTCLTNAVSGLYGKVLLPTGSLRIVTPINATNLVGLTIQGAGYAFYGYSNTNNITELKCDTGTVCLDTAGSHSMKFENFTMRLANTYATPSTVAVIEGRTASNGGSCYSENNTWERVGIWTDYNGTFNGTRGYIGFYDIGGEARIYSDGYVSANLPFVFATTNAYSVTSPYETLQTSCPQSMTRVSIKDLTITPTGGSAITAFTVADVDLNPVILMPAANNSGHPYAAISFNGTYATNWHGNLHVESLQNSNALFAIGSTVFDKNEFTVNIGGSTNDATGYIGFAAPGFTVGSNIIAIDAHNEATPRPFISNASAETVNGGIWNIGGSKSPLTATNITLNGTIVQADTFTDSNISFNSASQYVLSSTSGLSIYGAAKIRNGSSFLQMGSGQTAMEDFTAAGFTFNDATSSSGLTRFFGGGATPAERVRISDAGIKIDLTNGGFIKSILPGSATLTYTAIAANTCQEQTITVTGSTSGKPAFFSPAATLGNTNLSWSSWVSATNTVSVRVCNPTVGSITPSAVAWAGWVLQ